MVIATAAFGLSVLTLFSGFGLGMLLMPAFAIFLPVTIAIFATALVHLANNLFKIGLLGKHADWGVVVRFGAPACVTAMLGAWLLGRLSGLAPLLEYSIGEREFAITQVKLVVAGLMACFAITELIPSLEKLTFHPRWVPVGGVLSGFFGGLSGHQGALRAAFLIRLGFTKEVFIGTSAVLAAIVDVSRIVIYGMTILNEQWSELREQGGIGLVAAGTAAAFSGSFLGARLIPRVTLGVIKLLVGIMLVAVSVALGIGLI